MIKFYLTIFLLLTGSIFPALAQDTLYMKNGVRKFVKVEEIGPIVIRYKKYGNLSGPTYTVGTNTIDKIVFEDGKIEVMAELADQPPQNTSTSDPAPVLVNDSLNEAKYRKKKNYFSTNLVELVHFSPNLEYHYLFKNNVLALHSTLLYGINSDDRAKSSILNPWKKHIMAGFGLKLFVSPKHYKNQFYLSPLAQAGLLSVHSREDGGQELIYKVTREPIYILSINMGNITNLTPDLFIEFNGGIGVRRQHAVSFWSFTETLQWATFPTIKFGVNIGFRL